MFNNIAFIRGQKILSSIPSSSSLRQMNSLLLKTAFTEKMTGFDEKVLFVLFTQ